jgi:hypothetical protein
MQASLKIKPSLIQRNNQRLTEKQTSLLIFICEYLAINRSLPSNTETCEFLKVKSNNAGPYLKTLANKDYMYHERGVGYFPTSITLHLLKEMGRDDILNEIAVRDEEQLEMKL